MATKDSPQQQQPQQQQPQKPSQDGSGNFSEKEYHPSTITQRSPPTDPPPTPPLKEKK